MKNLIVTADDFGISKEVNEAVEAAHKNGIVSATSIMIGEPFADDAVRRARTMPDLGVGLHIALSRAHPVCAPDQIPGLVDDDGMLRSGLVSAGVLYFFSPSARHQLEMEITAQFEAFAKTGLPLDHINGHNHTHLHPTVLGLILKIGKRFGMKSIRLPKDNNSKSLGAAFLTPWLSLMKYRLVRNNISHNDDFLGLDETGSLTTSDLVSMINNLSDQTTELMCHPATGPWDGMDPMARDYRHDLEYAALIDDAVAKAIKDNDVNLIAYRDIP
ncbi:MAG: hopanoid biosynthesis-associated protein HpnK [Rhodospirillales bacterium]